ATACPPHVQLVARWVLKESARPDLDLEVVRRELLSVEFDDEVVKPRAETQQRGDSTANWLAAVNDLRSAYADHYLPALSRRLWLRRQEPPPQSVPVASFPRRPRGSGHAPRRRHQRGQRPVPHGRPARGRPGGRRAGNAGGPAARPGAAGAVRRRHPGL